MADPVVWFMTTGEAGYRTQARGLARRIAPDAAERVIGLRPPWRWLPGALAPSALLGLDPARDALAPPWPDLLVTCGRKSCAPSIAIRRASRGRTLTVHVQNPLTRLDAFDLVVAMRHDGVSGPNVLNVRTALHDVTPDRLAAAADAWRDRLAPDGRPLVSALLGGATRGRPFGAAEAGALADALLAASRRDGARLAVTPSRRTPPEALETLRAKFGDAPDVVFWSGEGENPYLGMLALAARIVVTGDSVSMISEALATTAAVEVVGEAHGRRPALFLADLMSDGLIRRFDPGSTPPGRTAALDSTDEAVQAVRALLAARTGVSG